MKSKKMNLSMLTVVMLLITMSLMSCKKNNTTTPVAKSDLVGSITGAKTLDASITYTITGPVIVENGGVLNIPAGTVIKANKGFNNYILILQGGKINVNGTADKPVIMTADIDNAEPGYWGGLVINGRAPLSGNTVGSTEISSAHQYGGTDANDNSGSITYLILSYTGARSSADVEHNGLTLNGVGNGTVIENIFIPNGADDGIEFFGGTVNVKNLLVINPDDDMFDFTQGYTGTLENAYGIWETGYTSTESDPRGIEADGNLDGNFPTQTGQSNFYVKNVTFDLRLAKAPDTDVSNVTNKMQDVIKIRRGAKATITNALVKGSGTAIDLIDFSDSKGTGDATSTISLTNLLNNTILGKEINPTTGFSGAIIGAGNTGCPTTIFSWTKYSF
ncbi:MAG: hypothetical protein KF781_04750 [Chitinophagaceae bacterium]|nr:hypothetical protein [Chitinophagaceae bacterium]MCW5904606.1 hypothetical protein [Chitinophagaceae bacterium]